MKKLLKIIAGLFGFIVLALLTIPFFISAETLKKQFVEQASKATGRKVEIAGNASLKLFPNIEVQLEGLTVGNPAGFTSPYLIKAQRIATGAALQPLLAGNLQISGITLESADIRLEQNAAGVKNWEFANAKTVESKSAEPKETNKASLIKSFALGDVVIRNSAITHKADGKTLQAENINLTVRGADMRGSLKVDGSANYQGKAVKANAAVANMKDLLAQKATAAKLSLALPGGKVNFDGKTQLAEKIAASGTVDVLLEDIPGLAKWAGITLNAPLPNKVTLRGNLLAKGNAGALKNGDVAVAMPGGTVSFKGDAALGGAAEGNGKLVVAINDLPATLQWATKKPAAKNTPSSLDLTADTSVKGKRYELKNLQLKAGDIRTNGNLIASLEGAVPSISGELAFGMLDMNAILKTAAATPRVGWMDAYAQAPAGWSDAPIDLSALKAVNADLAITAQQLRHGNLEVGDLAIKPKLNGGALTVLIEQASLYSGTLKGTLSASAGGSVGTNVTLTGIQIEPFLTALNGQSRIRGKANLELNMKAAGNSQRAMVSALNGNGRFSVADGALKGMNLASFWRDARKGFLFSEGGSKSTDFSELAGTFTIANGVVSNQDLSMKSPFLRVTGKGTVNLPPRTINYRITPVITDAMKGQGGANESGIAVPLDITGSFDNPSVAPDVTGMISDTLKDPKKLEDTIKNIDKNIKNLNSPEDIGKALLGGFGNKPEAAPSQAAPATPAPTPTHGAVPAPQPQVQPAPAAQPKPEEQLMQGVGDLLKGL